MAESAPSSLASGGQNDDQASKPRFASTGLENQEEGNAREGDYDVETVGRIYRFVTATLLISTYSLPIWFTERLIAVSFLLSGSFTSSPRPSSPTLELLKL